MSETATFPEWQYQFRAAMPYTGTDYPAGYMIRVEAGLHYLGGNRLPYFSVTAEIYRPKARDCDSCGCLHDDVARQWPALVPVIALHLCDSTGQPMHAEANGWYQLAGYYGGAGETYHSGNSKGHHGGEYRFPTPEECLQQFADHVRVSVEEARALANGWRCDDDPKASRRWFGEWLKTQKVRYQAEADAACALLTEMANTHAK